LLIQLLLKSNWHNTGHYALCLKTRASFGAPPRKFEWR